ncbi:MAG: hypothetical protein KJO31_13740 [Gammaproteobacteria bacterium]|nr:hypothetical protein [Gammaproteobacteria bacterium]
MFRPAHRYLILLLAVITTPSPSAETGFAGDWMIELHSADAPITGLLQLEKSAAGWQGYVEGGPVDVTIAGKAIEVRVDSRDLSGFVFYRVLRGTLDDGKLVGHFTIERERASTEREGTWTGVRKSPQQPIDDPQPVDLSGIWTPARGVDFRKYSMDLTPQAEEWHGNYLMHYDQPNVRCASVGIAAMVAWGAYPFEILETPGRLTFLYEVDSEVRRIYLDGTPQPEYYPPSDMGYSNAYWDGSELVIETVNLAANVRDFRGEPISDGASMLERYWLGDDGKTLNAVIELHDPVNYRRPPIRRRMWTRNPETRIYPYECDPESFYRQMYDEGRMDMYFERADRRN